MHLPQEPSHLPIEVPDPAAPDEATVIPLKIEDWLTVITMALLALVTFVNVLVRYFTDSSFAWTEEFSVFLMIVLAMVAGSAAVARAGLDLAAYTFTSRRTLARLERLGVAAACVEGAALARPS